MVPLSRSSKPVYEYACHEGNYSMTGILAGARAEESKKPASMKLEFVRRYDGLHESDRRFPEVSFRIRRWVRILQTVGEPANGSAILKTGRLLDVRKGTYIENAAVWIEHGRIREVGPIGAIEGRAPKDATIIDLSRETVLPGLIDCHTHLLARFADSPDGYLLGLATKSEAFRALEGAANARATLNAGFTTVRDVENEGSGYADVALRDAINRGLVEGPRMQVATRAIAAIGQYNPFGVSPDLANFPTGAQMISGTEDARRAVREQIGHGADLIKVYADWQHPTLTVEEMRIVVEEAHRQRLKVAAHATTAEGIRNALTAGVDSIEHGNGVDRQSLEMMKEKRVFLVPTVGGFDETFPARLQAAGSRQEGAHAEAFLKRMEQAIKEALSLGVKNGRGIRCQQRKQGRVKEMLKSWSGWSGAVSPRWKRSARQRSMRPN